MNNYKRYLPYIIGLVAFIYLVILAVKEYAFVFISTDSGDFLAASTVWMVAQTYGYPTYILLGHFLNWVPIQVDLAAKMTIFLSALPAAITVAMVYVIVLRLTNKVPIALVCSLVLLGTAVFLTEATITKGYALLGMFLTLAFWAYISGKKYITTILLALATTVHMITLTIIVFWFLADRRWKWWLGKPLIVYCVIAFIPYLLIPLLMYLDTPRLLAGSFSLLNVVSYFSGTGRAIIGQLSIFEAPSRLLHISGIIFMSFGLALIPLFFVKYKPLTRPLGILLGTILFILWYVATCLDAQTWTYLSLAAPSIAILIGLGLSRLKREHLVVVGTSAAILIVVNSIFLNAQKLEEQDPQGMALFNSLSSLPDKSIVVAEPGPYDLGLFYVMATGKQLAPIIYPYLDSWSDPILKVKTDYRADFGMEGYDTYLSTKFGLNGQSTLENVQQSLRENRPTYFIPTNGSPLTRCFVLEDKLQQGKPNRILSLTGLEPNTYVKDVTRGVLGD
jgi:hypothetical protein